MKSFMTISIAILFSLNLAAQTDYQTAMQDAMEKFGSAYAVSDLMATAAQFERIAEVETEEWLPSYYASLIYCIISFRTEDQEQKEQLVQQAQKQIERAMEVNSGESEVYTLQGMIYQSLMAIDPINNGQLYGPKANGAFQTAIKLDATNPRPYYLQGVSIRYTPEQYGGGAKAALPLLEQAMELFKADSTGNGFMPNWGREDCEQNLQACQEVQADS